MTQTDPTDEPLTPAEVSRLFGVTVRTVNRWADAGRIPCFRIPSGHRRFPRKQITALLPAPERTP